MEERAKSLRDGLTDESFLERHNPDLPYTFEVVLDNDDTAKSKRGAVVDMLSPSGSGSSYVVGMRGATGLILRLPTRESVELVASRMNEPDRYGAPITCVLRIGPFRPEVDAVEEGIFKVKLLRDRAEDGDNAGAFSTYLDTLGIEHKLLSYSKGMVIYKAARNHEIPRKRSRVDDKRFYEQRIELAIKGKSKIGGKRGNARSRKAGSTSRCGPSIQVERSYSALADASVRAHPGVSSVMANFGFYNELRPWAASCEGRGLAFICLIPLPFRLSDGTDSEGTNRIGTRA